jgi:AraC-like DNA-binding protein
MRYREFPVDPRLAPYVRLIWLLDIDDPADFGPPERVMPDGIVEVVFPYGAPLGIRFAGEPFAPHASSFAVSQTHRFVEVRPNAPTGFLSVRFHPWGAYHFFDVPVSAIADRAVGLDALWGPPAATLQERLAGASGDIERVALVEHFLIDQLERHAKRDVRPAVEAVWERRGQLGVSSLCARLGVTERTLERTFGAALGTSPKHFACLTRFLNVCDRLRDGRWESLSEVAHAGGYYDQSHFNADFKAFAGISPSGFVAHQHIAYLEI